MAEYFEMTADKQNVLNAGFDLFRMVLPGKKKHNKKFWGIIDLKMTDSSDSFGRQQRYVPNWLMGNEAHLTFDVERGGVASAWCVDDQYWHNRLHILSNRELLNSITFLRTSVSGDKTKEYVLNQFSALNEVLKEEKTIYEIYKIGNPRPISWKYTEEEAKEEIEDYMASSVRVAGDGSIRAKKNVRYRFDIKPGIRLVYKDSVKELQKKYARLNFGWSQCDEFMNGIKPEAEELAKKKYTSGASPTVSVAADLLKDFNEDDIATLKNLLAGIKKTKEEKVPERKEGTKELPFSKSALLKIKRDELVIIATDKGCIFEEEATRNDLIELILKSQVKEELETEIVE